MNIVVVTPPQFEPVSVAEVYDHLRWATEFDDSSPPVVVYPLQTLIEGYIVTARQMAEKATRRAIIRQTLRMTLSGFPTIRARFGAGSIEDDNFYRPGKIELKRPPLVSVSSVKYLDSSEVLQTLSPSHYYVDSESDLMPMLVFRDTFDPAIATSERQDAVRIEYVAGYPYGSDSPETQATAAANVPKTIKSAILLEVQLLADRFDPQERADIERARDVLLNSERVESF